jgi:hypothetical protein
MAGSASKMIRRLSILLLAAGFWPAEAHACSCVLMDANAAQRWERPWVGRQEVFIGYVLDADQVVDTAKRTIVRHVRFVTEASWRGSLHDTVTLFVDSDAPCAIYFPGWRYLVTADWDQQQGRRLTTARCDNSLGADGPVVERLWGELGPPAWTAPDSWSRILDNGAHRLGTPIPRSGGGSRVAFIPPRADSIARFEIGDFRGIGFVTGGPILYPEPGLYQVRVTWIDGFEFSGYVSIRCDNPSAAGGCRAFRNFPRLVPVSRGSGLRRLGSRPERD